MRKFIFLRSIKGLLARKIVQWHQSSMHKDNKWQLLLVAFLLEACGGDSQNLDGDDGDNVLVGSDQDNILTGGPGADSLDGRGGIDTASYVDSSVSVTIDLAEGTGEGGDAEGDTLIRIEGIIGSDNNDVLIGDSNANTFFGGEGADSLIGGDGDDLALYTGETASVDINLATGTGIGGSADGDSFISIESVYGGQGEDTLIGNSADNLFSGGLGADILSGGAGLDTALYSESPEAVTVNLLLNTGSGGYAAGDSFTSIENLIGSSVDDVLIGNGESNTLNGGAGDDTLNGDGNSDVLVGGDGNDTLIGGSGQDTVSYIDSTFEITVNLSLGTGQEGDSYVDSLDGIENVYGSDQDDDLIGNDNPNILVGGMGADFLDGGDGIDTASYATSTDSVTINLGTNSASGGDAANDTFRGIENLEGSDKNDVLIGNNVGNTLTGGAGSDSINGGGGTNTINYSDSEFAVTVNLLENTATIVIAGSDDEEDAFVNIENASGSNANDLLLGSNNTNVLIGGGGDDELRGRGAQDTLIGGIGEDTLLGGAGDDILDGGLGADIFFYQSLDEGMDTILRFTNEDLIDLSSFDSDPDFAGTQPLSFIGSNAFSASGQVRFESLISTGGILSFVVELNLDASIEDSEITIMLENPMVGTLSIADFNFD